VTDRARPRPPLLVAAGLLALEAVGALVFAVLEISHVDARRPVVGIGVSLIMAALAVLLGVLSRAVVRARRWSRSLSVMMQLILLLLGWSFREPPTSAVGVLLAVVGVVALVCLLLPSSTAAFLGEDPPAA